MKNWTLAQWLYVVGASLAALEPHVIGFIAPGWQPRVASAFAGIIAVIGVILAALTSTNATSPKDAPLVQAAASGALGDKALALASDTAKAKAKSIPPVAMVSMFVLAFACAGGTACTPAAQAVVQDVGNDALCVDKAISDAVQANLTTFEDIVAYVLQAGCGTITVATVEAIIKLFQAQQPTGSAMSEKLGAIKHKAP